MDGLSVEAGALADKGVFATRKFAAGEVVIAFTLEPLTSEQFHALPPGDELFVHSYGGRRWLYPAPARWVNHSDDPSCFQDFERSCDVALRPIEIGDAITIDATQETSRELSTFLEAYVAAQQDGNSEDLRGLIAADAALWDHGRVGRGVQQVISMLRSNPTQALDDVVWQVATGRWEALCSAELTSDGSRTHASLLLRVLSGNWQVVYEHRG